MPSVSKGVGKLAFSYPVDEIINLTYPFQEALSLFFDSLFSVLEISPKKQGHAYREICRRVFSLKKDIEISGKY